MVLLPAAVSRNALKFQPTTVYVSKTGEVFNPGRAYDHLPKAMTRDLERQGYRKRELTTFRAYSKFCKEMDQYETDRYDAHRELEKTNRDRALKSELDDLKRGCRVTIPDRRGRMREVQMPRLQDMSPRIREMVEIQLERRNNEKYGEGRFQPGSHIDAFENDRCSYNDKDTGFRKRYV